MKKRLASAVLALALLLGSMPAPVFAEDMAIDNGTALTAETPDTVDAPEPTAVPALAAARGAVESPVPTMTLGTTDNPGATLKVVSLPTAAGITYGQTLEEAALTGGSVETEDGAAVEGTFAWKTPWDIPDAGTREYDVLFTPKGEPGAAIEAGKVQVTVARAAVTITWPYDEEHLNYIEKPVAVTPPNVNTPDGRAHPGAITYEYSVKGEETYQPGLPRNVGTYYVRAAVAEAGNYQGAATGVDLELVIEKQPVTLLLEDYARTYDGTAVTMEDIPKEATVSVQLDPTDCIYVHEELPTASLAYTGLVGGQSLAPAEVRVDGMPTDTATAGEYTLTVSQATRKRSWRWMPPATTRSPLRTKP